MGHLLRLFSAWSTPRQYYCRRRGQSLSTYSGRGWLQLSTRKSVNADLRFINSASDAFALVIEMISFTPTQQVLRNGNFLQWADNATDRSPAGWMLKSGLLGSETEQAEVKL